MVEYMKSTNPSLSLLKKASKLPPMSRSACITALRSLSVSIYFCEEEGDAPVCELAQRLNGYMVSNGRFISFLFAFVSLFANHLSSFQTLIISYSIQHV